MVLLNTTISTQRAVVTQDAQGTPVENWDDAETIDEDVPASVQQMSASEVAAYSRREIDVDCEVFTRTPLAAKLNDRLMDADGNYFTIVDVDDMAGRGRWYCTACKSMGVGS